MKQEVLYSEEMPYRGTLDIKGVSFGDDDAEPSVCVVGALRGNEIQQLYICSQLIHRLASIERKGGIAKGKRIQVIPCANHISMNVGKRFWAMDNTDINRMFPGYDQGETTQRIADGLFKAVKGWKYGVQYASFHLEGDFLPHVRIMNAPGPKAEAADFFGLSYVVTRDPDPFDTTTLNYNWRLWDTDAYSVYTFKTDTINEKSAQEVVRATLRFMSNVGAIDYPCHQGYRTSHINESKLVPTHTTRGGIFRRLANPGDALSRGEVAAEIVDPLTGDVVEEVRVESGGIVFFACKTPLVTEHTLAFTTVPRGCDKN